ncbi:MAG TPA: signal peptidase I, partial [Nitrospirae bacterium]|nr:signal peptidase I [Nitrospirota bacterium]
MAREKSKFREYAEAVIIAIILALLIRTFVVQAFKIPSGSMVPTLQVGDHILVTKFIYGIKIPFTDDRFFIFKQPRRGDIIVFS